MISVREASSIILQNLLVPETEWIDIVHSCGRILSEPVRADRDLPPFDRVSMDGVALAFDAFQKGVRIFTVEGTQTAGMAPLELSGPDGCIEVMTGAVLPKGTDTVIRYEDIEISNKKAQINISEILHRQNIHRQGHDAKQNQELLAPGIKISPAEVTLMASVGKSKVRVFNFPETAVISTGDELVNIDQKPLAHQIRRSNDVSLQSALLEMGIPSDNFHIRDSSEVIKEQIKNILQVYKLLILSGGVSKGKSDFVPIVLESLGVKKLFHQVSQRPGKPFWFGRTDNHIVFALPGNPVSTYMCYYRYIKPWLQKCMGLEPGMDHAILAREFSFSFPLTYFLQVKIKNEAGKLMAWPEEGGGSGDFANLKNADGFLELPLGKKEFKAGESYPYIAFRN